MIRQKEYDEVTSWVLDLPTEKVPELAQLHSWLSYMEAPGLSTWYFKNKTHKELLPKEKEKEAMQKKIMNIVLITSLSLFSALSASIGTYKYMKAQEDARHAKKEDDFFAKELQDEKLLV